MTRPAPTAEEVEAIIARQRQREAETFEALRAEATALAAEVDDLDLDAGPPVDQANEMVIIRADRVKPERVEWLWPGRIPYGKLTVLDGDPGLGKSTMTLDLAARVTTASPLPDGHRLDRPRPVVLLSAEDGIADTLVPRLTAAGADLTRVHIIDHITGPAGPRPVEIPGDLASIEATMNHEAARLLVVDPLMAFLGGEVNSNRDQDIRRVLYRFKMTAEATGAAVVVVRHLNKMTGASALYRGGGSIGIVGAARAGLLVGCDPADDRRRVLAVSKSNLAAKPPSLAYHVATDELYDTARIVWDGDSPLSAEDLVGRALERPSPEADRATDFLAKALAAGPRAAAELRDLAKARGIAWRTVQRAADALDVEVERRPTPGKRGRGPSWWSLPNTRHNGSDLGMAAEPSAQVSGEHAPQQIGATSNTTPLGAYSSGADSQVSDGTGGPEANMRQHASTVALGSVPPGWHWQPQDEPLGGCWRCRDPDRPAYTPGPDGRPVHPDCWRQP